MEKHPSLISAVTFSRDFGFTESAIVNANRLDGFLRSIRARKVHAYRNTGKDKHYNFLRTRKGLKRIKTTTDSEILSTKFDIKFVEKHQDLHIPHMKMRNLNK